MPRNLETMAVSSSSSWGSPQLACSAALLAHPVHLEDHWIGNNTLPASPPPSRDTSGLRLLLSQRDAVSQEDGRERGAEQIKESN